MMEGTPSLAMETGGGDALLPSNVEVSVSGTHIMGGAPPLPMEAANGPEQTPLASNVETGASVTRTMEETLPPAVEAANGTEELSLPSIVGVEFANLTIEEMESRFEVGTPMLNENVAYGLYCIYAHAKGFSVRKDNAIYFTGGFGLKARDYVCSCQGYKEEKRHRPNTPAQGKPTLRCNCKAKIRVARLKGENWRVTVFNKEHNHDMHLSDQSQTLRSPQNKNLEVERCLEAMVRCGIPVAKAYEFLHTFSQGREDADSTPKDVSTRKSANDSVSSAKSVIEDGDNAQLTQHFISMSNREPYFYWNTQLDENNRLMNLFFRDYRCSIDYGYFGDVISVENTYRTNKYNMNCYLFLGVNHHLQNVMFGVAFLLNENESSLEWLFRTFLESMGGKQPETIYTDQCQAMISAVETVFSGSHHLLCPRHINRTGPSHFGVLNDDSSFKKLWHKCMADCESEEEFEHTWRQILEGYNIGDMNWFDLMYSLRYKWVSAFSRLKFTGGLKSISRKEGPNATLKRKFGAACSSLYDCVIGFESVQESWRVDEKEKDTRSHHGRLPIGQNPWLIQAAKEYTLEIFTLFQQEAHETLSFAIVEEHEVFGTSLMWFTLKPRRGNLRVVTVQFDRETSSVVCSCHKFETLGILCCHALKVFDRVNLAFIPERYIQKRWSKNVRNWVCAGRGANGGESSTSKMVFVHETLKRTYDLAYIARSHEETRCLLTESLEDAKSKVNSWFQTLSLDDLADAADGNNL